MLKTTLSSGIDEIPGIGAKRKKILFTTFGSYEKIKQASVNDLVNVPKFSKKLAVQVYNYLHNIKDE